MQIHQSTKAQNKKWAYFYMACACFMIAYASWKKENVFYLFATIMVALAAWRLFWLEKRL